jgi:hypothetical protein
LSVELFCDDDRGYADWLGANAHGYVLNIERSMNPSDARVHVGRLPDHHRHAAAWQDMDRGLR